MQDNFRHQGLRRKLINELRKKGINDEKILDAFYQIPRHFFLDLAFLEKAYTNIAFQIGAGQTISHPYTVAFQTQLLNLEKGEKVLEIGTGSGFQTCILCQLGIRVFTIERQKELFIKSKEIIKKFGFHPRQFYGDGYKGLETYQPFDKILITCGVREIPQTLVNQLKVGGIMVIPVGEGESQLMKRITKKIDNNIEIEDFGSFRFVPMLEKTVR
ncbi:MAG: protein-L-isoaspartate(D-aspartate) O-methyltransferase [Bacteroidetes bacterium]|nr:protein-L-isoaspartate(D-aspartate) O-methyltransferase [Bacteroidota bacterium]